MIDAAIDRLIAAYRAAGLPPIRPADAQIATLAEIRREISPLQLPDELDTLWRRVDPASITLAPYPHPTSPDFALQCWKSHRDEFPGMTPRLLFPVCYESHSFLFTELDDGLGSGGVCFDWGYCGSPFTVRFPSLAAYFDLLAAMIEIGEFSLHRRDGQSWYEFDPESRWPDAQAVRLSAAQPLPGFGGQETVDEDVRRWPEHWLLSNGFTPELRREHGATTTVIDLLRQGEAGSEARGTIRGRVVSAAGSAAGSRVGVDDGTGVLDLWCPAAVCTYGPVMRREFEFDVVVWPNPQAGPDIEFERRQTLSSALAHDLEGAQSAAADLYAKVFETPKAAEAIAIRPLD